MPLIGPILPICFKIATFFLPKLLHAYIPGKRQYYAIKKWEWADGLHALDTVPAGPNKNLMYINRGLASHPPGRFWCRPEITIFDIVPKKVPKKH